jgi:NAD(P)-dependent dehydrogenase (short-subunit alcohol dehydrogenase family)
LGLTRHLGYEVAAFGITVNSICPGSTVTPLRDSHTTEEERIKRIRQIPMGRMMEPRDHASLVKYLISDEAEAITGQAIDVDGGSLLGWVDYETYRAGRKFWTSKGK